MSAHRSSSRVCSSVEMPTGVDEPSRPSNFRRKTQLYFALFKHLVSLPFQHKIELRDPQQVLRQKLGNDLEVLEFTTGKLVNFGDNYNSTIVKATVQIKFEERTEKLNLVAKMLPQGEFVRKHLQCDVTMAKEIFFYEEVIPAYQKLMDFEIAPRFYGAQLSSKPEEIAVDEGALLLLENLKESGYVMAERLKGLTKDQLNIAIPSIAKFHATGLAIKQKDPVSYLKIKNHAKIIDLPPEFWSMLVSKLLKVIKNNRDLSGYHERVKSLGIVDSNGHYTIFEQFDIENTYACLTHRDLWINNVMFHENEGKIDGFKIFDFQLYNISSPMTDLLYFLFTSLQRDFDDFDDATKLYRESMCDALEKLGCNASLFEVEAFVRRLKEDAKIELYRCLIMANNIETRSAWDMIRTSPDTISRIKGILSIYESKGWFDN